MKKPKLIILPLLALVLSGCSISIITSSETESSNSESPLNESSEDISISEDTSTSEDSSISEEGTSEEYADEFERFRKTYPTDPIIPYEDSDYIVKDFPNGFTYPINARVQPTNAYLEFWHPETELNFRISASKEIFNLIEQCGYHDQKYADLYFPVTLNLKMNGKELTYYEVGMRMKGNTSRTQFLDEHTKDFIACISFKLSFNELWDEDIYESFGLKKEWKKSTHPEWKVRDDRTFMCDSSGKSGMKKIDVKWNKSPDPSLVMQPFVFSFFQRNGLISQNSTLATLKMNDTRFGVVTINEPIDKHLLRRYFDTDSAKGDLYKVGWGETEAGNNDWVKGSLRYEDLRFDSEGKLLARGIVGEEDKFNYYTPAYDAKEYNSKIDNPFEKIVNLMRVLKDLEGKQVAEYAPLLEEVIDVSSFLRYAALCYLTGNPDDMRNSGNNYYIFFNPSEGNKAYFIPYDYDWSLNINWYGGTLDNLSPYHSKHEGDGRKWQSNRLFWATIINKDHHSNRDPDYDIILNSAYRNEYKNFVSQFSNDSQFSGTYYNEVYATYRTTYENKTTSDLDNRIGRLVSPFESTEIMTGFINGIKNTIEHQL